MSALSLLGNKNESTSSTTKAAVGENIGIVLTNDSNAESTLSKLNRDTANANQKVNKHDITEVQETQALIKGIGEIATKAYQIYTHSEREAVEQAKLELGKAKSQNASKEEIGQLAANLDRLQKAYDANYGTGSSKKRALDAVTAALQGLAAKDAGQAAVGLASPYLNKQIKELTQDDTQANLIAHALLGAVEAAATGNNLLAGAVAGAGSEAAAKYLAETLYPNKTPEQLTEAEKQNVVFLSQLAGGLAAGLARDSTQSAAIGADIGKRAVENNYLSKQDWIDFKQEIAACGDNQECIKGVKDEFFDVNRANSETLKAACRLGGSSEACAEHTNAAREGFDYARSNIPFDGSGWMAQMMNTNKAEAKVDPSKALQGSEVISNIEKALSDPNIRLRLEKDPVMKRELEKTIDQAANAVRTEKTNAYEFSAKFEYPSISGLSNNYKVFGRELGAEPVVPEYYVYSALGAGKMGKSLFDLSSPSTRLIVGANSVVSAGSQYLANGEISVSETLKDTAEAYVTKGFNFRTYTAWNLGTGFIEGGLENVKWQDGRLQGFSVENALERAGAKTVTSTLGYGLGKGFENTLNKNINTYGNSLRTEPIRVGSPISRFTEPSLIPVGIGNIFDSSTSKSLEIYWNNYNLFNGGKNENFSK